MPPLNLLFLIPDEYKIVYANYVEIVTDGFVTVVNRCFDDTSCYAPKHDIDNREDICYIAHMNTMLLDSLTAAKVEDSLPNTGNLTVLAMFFDALSDVTRLKILSALSVSPMCVTDLSTLTSLNQTTVSHQLRILKTAKIVCGRRQGKVMFYSLSERAVPKILNAAVGAVMDGSYK